MGEWLNTHNRIIVYLSFLHKFAFSTGAWAEFAFILAVASFAAETIDEESLVYYYQ